EISPQSLPEKPGFYPDNGVLARIIGSVPAKNVFGNLLLARIFQTVVQGTVSGIQKELPQPWRFAKSLAIGHLFDELPLILDRPDLRQQRGIETPTRRSEHPDGQYTWKVKTR
ncbi:MAG: hypothetical protein WBW33_06190, partial [Bryobacteraceae bacterium]